MKTLTTLAIVAIIAAVGMMGASTAMLSQHASASEAQLNCHSDRIQESHGSGHSNFNLHILGCL